MKFTPEQLRDRAAYLKAIKGDTDCQDDAMLCYAADLAEAVEKIRQRNHMNTVRDILADLDRRREGQ